MPVRHDELHMLPVLDPGQRSAATHLDGVGDGIEQDEEKLSL
jgi:hypothetical protein